MAIRKDIDDMLNSLKSGTPSQPEKPVSELPKLRRKTKFDNMSVDDLLTAISEPDPVQPQPAPADPPVVDEPVNISVPDPEPEHVFQFVQDDEPEFPQKAPEEHHNIVINEELPDYEAIRQAQLEMDRLERERAAAAASFNAAREHEHTASVDELQQFSARIAAENTAGKVAEDAAAALSLTAMTGRPLILNRIRFRLSSRNIPSSPSTMLLRNLSSLSTALLRKYPSSLSTALLRKYLSSLSTALLRKYPSSLSTMLLLYRKV